MILVAHFYLAIAQNVKRFGRFWWNKSSIVCRIEMTGSFPGGSSVVGHPANLLLLSSVNNSHATAKKVSSHYYHVFLFSSCFGKSLNPWVCCVFSVVLRNFFLHTLCLDLAQHKTWIRGCEDGVENRQGGTKTVFSSPRRMSPTLSPPLLLCRVGSKRWSTYKGISYWTDVAVLLLFIIFSLKLWPWLFHFFRKGKCKSLIINIRNGCHPALLMYNCYGTLL